MQRCVIDRGNFGNNRRMEEMTTHNAQFSAPDALNLVYNTIIALVGYLSRNTWFYFFQEVVYQQPHMVYLLKRMICGRNGYVTFSRNAKNNFQVLRLA
jgi:hypothetical protein